MSRGLGDVYKRQPLIVTHGKFDDIVPVDASRMIYEKVKTKTSSYCELIEFDGFHQIDSYLVGIISSKISNIF